MRPLEFARGRIVAEVETAEDGGALLATGSGAALGEDFEVRPLGMDGETLRVAIASRAAPEPATMPGRPRGRGRLRRPRLVDEAQPNRY